MRVRVRVRVRVGVRVRVRVRVRDRVGVRVRVRVQASSTTCRKPGASAVKRSRSAACSSSTRQISSAWSGLGVRVNAAALERLVRVGVS